MSNKKSPPRLLQPEFKRFLPLLINCNHTCYVKGSYIGENIRLISDILEQIKTRNMPGILLMLEFKKAFDTVEWKFIQKSLDLFNFGSSIKQWVKTFYTNTESAVLRNGSGTVAQRHPYNQGSYRLLEKTG